MQTDVFIDHVHCSGCGSCIELCPQIFAWDAAEEKAVVLDGAGECADLETAVITCPQDCIFVTWPEPAAGIEGGLG